MEDEGGGGVATDVAERAIVGIFDLQVLIVRESDGWVAQGLEIDYAVCGTSLDDVRSRFQRGLSATIQAHFGRFGSLDGLLQPTPTPVWADLARAQPKPQEWLFTSVSVHDFIGPEANAIPFTRIKYAIARELEAAAVAH